MQDDKRGMLRHVDILGRVVIPMEVRKALHICYGDLMEFCLNSNKEVLIKKHYLLDNVIDAISQYISIIRIMDKTLDVVVCNNENIVLNNETKLKEQCLLPHDIMGALSKSDFSVFKQYSWHDKTKNLLIQPIISNGERLGGIVLITDNEVDKYAEIAQKLSAVFAQYLDIK